MEAKFDNAVGLLRRTLGTIGHEHSCSQEQFRRENKHIPVNHPAWRMQPDCDCLVGAIAEFLNKNT